MSSQSLCKLVCVPSGTEKIFLRLLESGSRFKKSSLTGYARPVGFFKFFERGIELDFESLELFPQSGELHSGGILVAAISNIFDDCGHLRKNPRLLLHQRSRRILVLTAGGESQESQ